MCVVKPGQGQGSTQEGAEQARAHFMGRNHHADRAGGQGSHDRLLLIPTLSCQFHSRALSPHLL